MGAVDQRDHPVGQRREGRPGLPPSPRWQAHRGDGDPQGSGQLSAREELEKQAESETGQNGNLKLAS